MEEENPVFVGRSAVLADKTVKTECKAETSVDSGLRYVVKENYR